MASSLALRRVVAASSVLSRLTNPLHAASVAPNVTRSLNTSSQMRRYYDDDEEGEVDVRVKRRSPSPLSMAGLPLDMFSDLRMDMPGRSSEDVKVSVEQNTLTIKGGGEEESGKEESGRRFSSRVDLPSNLQARGDKGGDEE